MNPDFVGKTKYTDHYYLIDDIDIPTANIPFLWDLCSVATICGVTPQDIGYMIAFRKDKPLTDAIARMKKTGHCDKNLIRNTMLGYDYCAIPKKTGGFRVIAAPKPKLRAVQMVILQKILKNIPVHEIASAYISKEQRPEGWSWQQAIWNVAKDSFLLGTADIKDFFGSINYHMVNDTLIKETKYNKEVCWVLTQLMTELGITQQGALTSPAISNIIMKEADTELNKIFSEHGWKITRYSDNYVFGKSIDPYGDTLIGEECQWPITTLRTVLKKYGFTLNEKKSWCREKSAMKPVMGLVAFDKLNSPKYVYERLRNSVYNFIVKKEIPALYNGDPKKYFYALRGKVNYWLRINPTRYQKLHDMLLTAEEPEFFNGTFESVGKYNRYWKDTVIRQKKFERKYNPVEGVST